MKNLLAAIAAVAILSTASPVWAQPDEIELPRMGRLEGVRILGSSGASSVQVSRANGVTTTTVRNADEQIKIVESEEDGIQMKVTRSYGPDDMELLKKEHPDLVMHLSAFPKTSGNAQIAINLRITKTYEAANQDELKKNHPDIHEIYEKYANQGAGDMLRLDGIRFEIDGLRREMEDIRADIDRTGRVIRIGRGGGADVKEKKDADEKKKDKDKNDMGQST